MYLKVIAKPTMNIGNYEVPMDLNLKNISGLCANVCYSDGYDENTLDMKMSDTQGNINRFNRVVGTGHHSVADHTFITVYIGGISKMLAMILNSLEYYTTSERSARYTDVSKTVSGVEYNLYSKWKGIIEELIEKSYPNIDSKRRTKLAMENARYFISVFNKTTSMVYSTTYRQWSYIMQWCMKFVNLNKNSGTYFIDTLCNELEEFSRWIKDLEIGTYDITDIKNRQFKFLTKFDSESTADGQAYVYDSYKVKYKASLACLAQAQRHRTLEYYTSFDGNPKLFYVPEILTPELSLEWLDDMRKVGELVPQGTLVDVIEMGTVENFLLKCKERLCGRAQLEITKLTANTLKVLRDANIKNAKLNCKLKKAFVDGRPKAKCELIGVCNEACEFGAKCAVTREI